MLELLSLLILFGILANLGAWFLIRRFPAWSRRKTAIVASLPLPTVIWAFCLFVFVDAATSSRESCGVDACGMAMAASMMGFAVGLVGFAAGLGGAAIASSVAGQSRASTEGSGKIK